MSRPWRGGYSNRRPYNKGPRGGGGLQNNNQRYSRWDSDNHFSNNGFNDKDERYNQCNFNGPPIYMNSDNNHPFWQNYYQPYQPTQFQQQGPPNQIYNNETNSWNSSYRNYNFPNHVNRQYSNQSNNDNSNFTSSNIEINTQNIQSLETVPSGRPHLDSESSQTKTSEEPVIAHPGSEAAREKERAEIAERLKQLDKQKEGKQQEGNKDENVGSKEKRSPSKSSSVPLIQRKRNLSLTKSDVQETKKVKINEKSTAASDKTRISNSQKDKVDTHSKSKESQSQRKVSSSSKHTSVQKTPTSGRKRREIVPIIAAKNSKKSSPATKKTPSPATANKSSSNQNKSASSTALEKPAAGVKNNILTRLAAMGKDEIRSLINNPQLPKSQEMLKTLMKCYQETKALELDKRRFTIAAPSSTPEHISTTGNTSDSAFFNLSDLASIAMSDLPLELVSQIQTFLGCDIGLSQPNISQSPSLNDSSLPLQFQDSNSSFYLSQNSPHPWNTNLPSTSSQNNFGSLPVNNVTSVGENDIRDNISDSSTEKAPSPNQSHLFDPQDFQFQSNFNLPPPYFDTITQMNPDDNQTPFMILNELSLIDLRIQADIQRKMQLYKQLHIYLQNHANQNTSLPIPISNNPIENFIPPPPFPNNQNITNNSGILQNGGELNLIQIPGPSSASPLQQEPQPVLQPKDVPSVITIEDEEDSEPTSMSSHQHVQPTGTAKRPKSCSICCRSNKAMSEKVVHQLPSKMKINDMKVVNRKTVVLACEDGVIYGYDLETGKESHKFEQHKSAVNVIISTPKRNDQKELIKGQFTLCSGGSDEVLCFFDFESQQCVYKQYLASSITCLEQGAPNILYVGVNCGQIFMCNIETMQLMGSPIDCGSNSILSILATREGPRKVLFISSVGRPIVMRDAQNGLLLRTFKSSGQEKIVGLAEYGNLLFCRVLKKGIPYFNITNGGQEGLLTLNNIATSMTVYKHLLIVGCCGGQIYMFDLRTKEKLLEFTGTATTIKCLQVKYNRIITCGGGKAKKLEVLTFPSEVQRNLRSACSCKSN